MPTAPNVNVRYRLDDNNFRFYDQNGQPVGPSFPFRASNDTSQTNDTFNAIPFMAGIWKPSATLYGIGFLQIDVPLNQSKVDIAGATFVANQPVALYEFHGRIAQQVLLRTNIGIGKWLWQNDRTRYIKSLSVLGECTIRLR